MSAATSVEEPGGPREWLIRKGIYFYRPGKSGYTTVKSQAGRYTELDARREAETEPWHMDAIHQDMVPDPAGDINVSEIASLKAALAATQEENRRLKEALILMPMAARLAELPDFMAALSEWGCTDPNEQAASIADFLNSLVGLREYLESTQPNPDHGAAG